MLKSLFDKDFKEVEASLFSFEDIKKLLSIGRSDEHVVLQVLSDDASKQSNTTKRYLSGILAPFVTIQWQVIKLIFRIY